MGNDRNTIKGLIYQSELDFISERVLDYPNLETGGDLFGFWNKQGQPIIQYVIGPGENVNRSTTNFIQDIPYLKERIVFLNKRYGLDYIGGWHSHHKLSLSNPSSGDINTTHNALREGNNERLLIAICNIKDNNRTAINGYLFIRDSNVDYLNCKLDPMEGISPFRESISHFDNSLFKFTKRQEEKPSPNLIPEEKEKKAEKPDLIENSFWAKPEGRDYLKKTVEKLNYRKDLSNVEMLQLADKRIAISFKRDGNEYEIRFPNDFPKTAPEVIEKELKKDEVFINRPRSFFWGSKKHNEDIFKEFMQSLDIFDKKTVIIFRKWDGH